MFLAMYFVIVRSRTRVYCDDSRVNVEINKSVKYEWSRCMLLHSGMAAIIAFVTAFLSTEDLPAVTQGFFICCSCFARLAAWSQCLSRTGMSEK